MLTLTRGTAAHVHVSTTPTGGVEVALDHPDALDRHHARITQGDDAAAVVDLDRSDAVALAYALLSAAGVDPAAHGSTPATGGAVVG